MLLDRLSQFIARVRGLPILLAMGLVLLNFLLQFVDVPVIAAVAGTNVFLHLAVIMGLLGVLLSEALGAW